MVTVSSSKNVQTCSGFIFITVHVGLPLNTMHGKYTRETFQSFEFYLDVCFTCLLLLSTSSFSSKDISAIHGRWDK